MGVVAISDVSLKRRKRPVYRGRPRMAFADVKRGDKIMMRKGGIQVLDEVFGLDMTHFYKFACFPSVQIKSASCQDQFLNTKHEGPVK